MQSTNTASTLLRSGAVVGYLCIRKRHLSVAQAFTLTIHNGEWAFCHDAHPVGAHRWMATGGISLADVQRSSIARELATD
jgi:hypothetical protein